MRRKRMAKKSKTILESKELEILGKKVIKAEELVIGEARIGYLFVDPYISKTTAGKCIRNNTELEYFSQCDFLIQMSKKLWDNITEEARYILMLHELMHIDFEVKYDKKLDQETYIYKIKDHDVKDFQVLIERYGINWLSVIKGQVAVDNDLDMDTMKLNI
jgi:hypothetical protein